MLGVSRRALLVRFIVVATASVGFNLALDSRLTLVTPVFTAFTLAWLAINDYVRWKHEQNGE